jgi:hypothetical protein
VHQHETAPERHLTEITCIPFQVTVAVDEAKNEHEILQTFAEGADAPLE